MDKIINPKRQYKSQSDSRYFYTHSLYLAAYLYARGLWLANAEKEHSGRYRFAFQNSAECEALVRQFQYGPEAPVDARTFMYALQELKRRANILGDVIYE